jgi:hypothetical protein
MVLGIAAAVVKPTQQVIESALAAVKTTDVTAWARNKLGLSVQARRRLAFQAAHAPQAEQKPDNTHLDATPGF